MSWKKWLPHFNEINPSPTEKKISMEAIILAGGLGTRLRSTVPNLPKPLAPVKGKPFLCHLMDYWLTQGIKRFILSVGYQYESIHKFFGPSYQQAELTYSIENRPLGTGGGLIHSLDKLQSDNMFLVLNGDTYFPVNLNALQQHQFEKGADLTLSLVEVTENVRYNGVLLNKNGWVESLEAQTGKSFQKTINAGVYMVDRRVFKGYKTKHLKKTSLENEILPDFLNKKKKISGFLFSAPFLDIGVPEDYYRAGELFSPNRQAF